MILSRLLRASLRTIALRWVLAAFLLVAQQGALTHALSHAGGHAHEAVAALHEHAHGHEATDAACSQEDIDGRVLSEQCAFDLVYSQVLGGVHAGHTALVQTTNNVVPVVAVAQSFSAATHVPYDTRGPPAIS
jgi:hypothetical protein